MDLAEGIRCVMDLVTNTICVVLLSEIPFSSHACCALTCIKTPYVPCFPCHDIEGAGLVWMKSFLILTDLVSVELLQFLFTNLVRYVQ